MKKIRNQLILLIALCAGALFLVGVTTYIVDPFFMYHKPLSNWNYVIDNQLEQNPGIAKHFEFDSVMLGSSMTTNFDTNIFNETIDTNMVKLSYNAAFPKDIDSIMEIVAEEKGELKQAFLCIDIANYMSKPGTLSYTYPDHLYDKNPLNDLKYLLNKDVFLTYVVGNFIQKENTPINEIYWHWQYMIYGREYVLSRYEKPELDLDGELELQKAIPYTLENLKINLEECIIPHIEAMPNTQWHVFFPPYSMLYWYDSIAAGELETKVDGMALITEMLGAYSNVKIHYFQDMEEWITDLDNYTDKTHFSKAITDDMTKRLCEDTNLVNMSDYKEQLETFERFLQEFDYEGFVKQ